MQYRLKFSLFLILSLALTGVVYGQSATATLRGTVTDNNGGIVPGSTVTLTRPATREIRTATADDNGQYTFTSLQPDDYILEVQGKGFKSFRQANLKLDVGQIADVNAKLEVGLESIEVTVESNSQLQLETASGSLGGVIEQQRVEALPLNGRNLLQLASLEPGVANTSESRADFPTGQQAGSFSVNGGRGLTNEITFDGITAVNKADNVPAFRASPSAIQEFRVQTSTYSAESGRSGGGQVSFVTRPGTKRFSGSLYDFFRNQAVDANHFSATATGLARRNFGPISSDLTLAARFTCLTLAKMTGAFLRSRINCFSLLILRLYAAARRISSRPSCPPRASASETSAKCSARSLRASRCATRMEL